MIFLHKLQLFQFKTQLQNLETKRSKLVKSILKAIDENNTDDYIQYLRNEYQKVDQKIKSL